MYSDERGQSHEYQQILEQNRLAYQSRHLDTLRQKPNAYPYNLENLKKGCDILINARLAARWAASRLRYLDQVDKKTYEPTILIGTHTINDTAKLHLMFIGHVLAKVQGNPPATGHIITADGKPSKVRLQQSRKTLSALLEPLQKWSTDDVSPAEPPVTLNKHCPLCQFRVQCEAKAIQEDNLSRLAGVTPRGDSQI